MTPQENFYGWRMVALAFIAYNFGLTVVTNVFAPVLVVLQQELNTSRAAVSLAFGLLMLTMGVLAPVVGNLAQRFKLRTLMATGAALNALGFLLLVFAHTLTQVILLYGLLLGAGVCFMALICAPALISRWFEHDRGKALGIGLVQVFALFTAPLAAWLLSVGGKSLLFFLLAAVFVLLIPVMSLVIDRPETLGQTPRRAPEDTAAATANATLKTSGEILGNWRFWLLSVTIGIFTAAGVTLTSHGPAMAIANGINLTVASTVLSATGAGALAGAFVFGWLIDRIGPFRALIVDLLFTAAAWLIFSHVTALPLMVALGFFMGAGLGPSVSLHSACVNEIFGAANFSRVMGYSYFFKLPFLVGPAPLVGRLYDLSGGYGSTYIAVVTGLVLAALLAAVLAFDARQRFSARLRMDSCGERQRPDA